MRAPPKPVRPRVQRMRQEVEREYELLADQFARLYAAERAVSINARYCIAQALRRLDMARRHARGPAGAQTSRIDAVCADVARRHGITVEDLINGGRSFARARAEAYIELRDMRPRVPYEDIGRHFGLHHSSVIQAEAKARALAWALADGDERKVA